MKEFKRCDKCGKKFIPVNQIQRYCQEPCTAKNRTLAECNDNWIKREISKRKLNRRKDYHW
jgi:hypothetical protein